MPSMPDPMLLWLWSGVVMAGGVARRLRGGLAAQWARSKLGGTHVARLGQAAVVGGCVAALGAPWTWAAIAAGLFLLGTPWGYPRLLPHRPWVSMKSNMIPQTGLDTLSLSINAVIAYAPLAAGAWWAGLAWGWVVAAGALWGPLYWLAAAHTPAWRWAGFEEWAPDQKRWILAPTALTEFYAGCALHLALVIMLVGR